METDKISKTNLESYSVDDILNLKFRLVLNSDLYQKVNGLWINQSENESYVKDVVSKSPEIKVVGIIKPSESTVSQPTMGGCIIQRLWKSMLLLRRRMLKL